jgi:hypothetical protein
LKKVFGKAGLSPTVVRPRYLAWSGNLVTKRATDVIARTASKSIGEEKPYKRNAMPYTLGILQDSSTSAKNWSNSGCQVEVITMCEYTYSIWQRHAEHPFPRF